MLEVVGSIKTSRQEASSFLENYC